MSILNFLKAKKPNDDEPKIYIGERISAVSQDDLRFSSAQNVTNGFLRSLLQEQNAMKAIELICTKTSDGAMAINTWLRLSNQGFKLTITDKTTGLKTNVYDQEIKDWFKKVGKNSSAGFDEIINNLHWSEFMRGGQACEVLVSGDGKDIDDIVVVDPITFDEWEYDHITGAYKLYQKRQDGKKINLFDGNFFWEAHNKKLGRPDGRLMFESSIMATKQFYDLLSNSFKVMEKVSSPKYDITVNRESLAKSIKSGENISDEMNKVISQVSREVSKLEYGSAYAHTDDTSLSIIGAGEKGSGFDVRAWFEIIEPLIVNSFLLTPVFLGRLTGGSYALAETQYKLIVDTIDSTARRNSKRIAESILDLWSRVKGYNIDIKFDHNPLDMQEEKIKKEIEKMNLEIQRRREEYGYISSDEASNLTGSMDGAFDPEKSKNMWEFLSYQNDSQNTEGEVN